MQSIGLPEAILNSINRIIFTFIWKKKHNNKKAFEKVKRKILTQDINRGELKTIDIKTLQQTLYLSWIPKLIEKSNENNPSWKAYPDYLFSKLCGPGLAIINTPCKSEDLVGMPKTAGIFWSNIKRNTMTTIQISPPTRHSGTTAICNTSRKICT